MDLRHSPGEVDLAITVYKKRIKELGAENARLKRSLERIAKGDRCDECLDDVSKGLLRFYDNDGMPHSCPPAIAKEALK